MQHSPESSGSGVTYTCDPNFGTAQFGVVTRWTPVKNLTFSAEVAWFHLDQKMGNGPGLTTSTSLFGAGAPKPVAICQWAGERECDSARACAIAVRPSSEG
jgi:hypothetical protein